MSSQHIYDTLTICYKHCMFDRERERERERESTNTTDITVVK